jgi:SAM-dependent methyltransferases related to tRNA (uracil-5-)-methyltransferase
MTTANRYLTSWENYWSTLSGTPGEIFWDADPAHAAQQDLGLFPRLCRPQLPLIDLGCGNGTQTRFLADHFSKVIGTEISPAAVRLPKRRMVLPMSRTVCLTCCALRMPKPSTRKLAMPISTCERVASAVSCGSRDRDTEYRAAAWSERNFVYDRTVISG